MADLKLQSKDALLDVNAGLGGLHKITLSCRNRIQVFQPDELQELADLLYPAIDAWAKQADPPPSATKPTEVA